MVVRRTVSEDSMAYGTPFQKSTTWRRNKHHHAEQSIANKLQYEFEDDEEVAVELGTSNLKTNINR